MDIAENGFLFLVDLCRNRIFIIFFENSCFFINLDKFFFVVFFSIFIRVVGVFDWMWIIIWIKRSKNRIEVVFDSETRR